MSTRKTTEEKEILIADYMKSGLSMGTWCSTHNIATSTLSGWINKRKKKATKTNNDNKFVELTFPVEQPLTNVSNITIEYKAFKISIPANADFKSLENTLKVVTQINV